MKKTVPIILVCLAIIGTLGYGGYRHWLLNQENEKLTKQIVKMKDLISEAAWEYDQAEESLESLNSRVSRFSDGSTNWSDIVPEIESDADTLSSNLDDIEAALNDAYDPDSDRLSVFKTIPRKPGNPFR